MPGIIKTGGFPAYVMVKKYTDPFESGFIIERLLMRRKILVDL